jgi:hypothetical protein
LWLVYFSPCHKQPDAAALSTEADYKTQLQPRSWCQQCTSATRASPQPLATAAGDKKDKKGATDKLVAAKEKKSVGNGAAAAPARPAPRRPPQPQPQSDPNDYLAGLDLPSSESESDGEVDRRRGMLEDESVPQIKQAVRAGGSWGSSTPCGLLQASPTSAGSKACLSGCALASLPCSA